MSSLVQEHLESYTDYSADQIKPVRLVLTPAFALAFCFDPDLPPQFTSGLQLQEKLHQIHLSRKCQPYAYRMHYLKQIGYLLQDNAEAICESVKKDLGRNKDEVSFTEVWTSIREVDLTVKRLKEWMKDETAFWDTILAFKGNSTCDGDVLVVVVDRPFAEPCLPVSYVLLSLDPRVKKQPKGVVLASRTIAFDSHVHIR